MYKTLFILLIVLFCSCNQIQAQEMYLQCDWVEEIVYAKYERAGSISNLTQTFKLSNNNLFDLDGNNLNGKIENNILKALIKKQENSELESLRSISINRNSGHFSTDFFISSGSRVFFKATGSGKCTQVSKPKPLF